MRLSWSVMILSGFPRDAVSGKIDPERLLQNRYCAFSCASGFLEKNIPEDLYSVRILSELLCSWRLVNRFDRPFMLRVSKPIESNME